MFEAEDQPYPMPKLASPIRSAYKPIMQVQSNRRSIPMGIQLPNSSIPASVMITKLIGEAIGGEGIEGQLISTFMQIGWEILKKNLESDDDDD